LIEIYIFTDEKLKYYPARKFLTLKILYKNVIITFNILF